MSRVLLATCSRLPDGDEDAALLLAALARLDVDVRFAVWDDPAIDWSDGLVVLRSTWDYTARHAEFLRWAAAVPRLVNPLDVVQWSSDKRYLLDLEVDGLPIVPTDAVSADVSWTWPNADEIVVKPSVGAGSRSVGRFTRARSAEARAHVESLIRAGFPVLVQPYLEQVDVAGETALIFLDGRFSHAIRKAPMLPAGAVHALGSDQLYVPESIDVREPSHAELAVGTAVLGAVRDRFGADLLYARVDLLPAPDGPVVVELELVEPSLFFSYAPAAAADRFAAAIAARA